MTLPWIALLLLSPAPLAADSPVRVEVPVSKEGEVELNELVDRLAAATGLKVERPPGVVKLPVVGLAGSLSRTMLNSTLGPGAEVQVGRKSLVVTVAPERLAPSARAGWEKSVRELASQAEREARRRLRYGMHATRSYRPNDPNRPTICLIHGVNSSSYGFVHMIPPLEEAGFGVVVYDYPFNRSLDASCEQFGRDWTEFRKVLGEQRPWAIVAHSMGALVARGYIEGPDYAGGVSSLVMIAPVNQGSSLAQTQTILQLLNGLQAVGGPRPSTDALAHLGDGLGEAAADMLPGSPFLKRLNARPRREGVAYRILAGDVGLINKQARQQIESNVEAARRQAGVLGGLARLATPPDLSGRLDEVSDGTGDGAVSVARTRLAGVTDHVTIHANHAELIRAPLLFKDPGPVACMPQLLEWLRKPRP
ncbi:MAG: alpha/beta fold hydrolase [Isosphaeraceae bacterium]